MKGKTARNHRGMLLPLLVLALLLLLPGCGRTASDGDEGALNDASRDAAASETEDETGTDAEEDGESLSEEDTEPAGETPEEDAETPEEPADEPEETVAYTVIDLTWDSVYGYETTATPDSLELVLDGTLDDGTYVCISGSDVSVTDPEGNPVTEGLDNYARVFCSTGHMGIIIYRTDGRYSLAVQPSQIEEENVMFAFNVEGLTATVSGSDSGYYTTDNGVGLVRWYTGVWTWSPFDIDHGKLAEYTIPDVLQKWYDSQTEEAGGQEETEETASQEESMSLEDRIQEIRDVYYETRENLDSYLKDDQGDCVYYFDSTGDLRLMTTTPHYYDDLELDMGGYESYTAEYYYEDLTPKFVFVYSGDEEYRFYMDGNFCYRYIDSDGVIYDFPEGTSGEKAAGDVGSFCSLAYMELHWLGLI
ncbi:MAG: hypothetical protein LUH16_04685 [Clostridiales bacterium]|nr:hypothetical protein [Clostridiales bacterium]